MYKDYKPKETLKELIPVVKSMISILDGISEKANREYLTNSHVIPNSTNKILRDISQETRGLVTKLKGLDHFS